MTQPSPMANVSATDADMPRAGLCLPIPDSPPWLQGIAVAVVIFAGAQILMFPFGRDQGVFATIADTILNGGMPFRDAWDIHPPGIYLVYATSEWLFGHRMIAPRILEVAGILSLYFPLRIISRDLYHTGEIGVFGWPLAAMAYAISEYWYTGQSESFGAILTIWALAFAVDSAPWIGRVGAWSAMGLLFGVCFLLKPQLALTAIPCAVYAGWMEWRRARSAAYALAPALIGGAASALPIAACAAWIWSRGAWAPMAETYLRYAPAYASIKWLPTASRFGTFSPVAVMTPIMFVIRLPTAVLIGLVATGLLMHQDGRRNRAAALLGAAIMLQFVGVAIAQKLYPYHYFVAMLLTVVVAADGYAKLWERYTRVSFGGAIALGAAVLGLGLFILEIRQTLPPWKGGTQFWRRSALRTSWMLGMGPNISGQQLDGQLYNLYGTNLGDYEQTAAVVDAITRPGDSIFLWGSESVIYWLADRRPASHWIHDFPPRANWYRDEARASLMRELEGSAPAVIIVEAGDYAPDIVDNSMDSAQSLQTFPQLQDYLRKYFTPASQIGRLYVFRRTGTDAQSSLPLTSHQP